MINIEELIPFMKKGWVAMDENGVWTWFDKEPYIPKDLFIWAANSPDFRELSKCFDIAPAEDWEKSLRKVG